MASKDYANGKIYCLRNIINNDVYVGSTTQPLSKRMVKHRCDAKHKYSNRKVHTVMFEIGIDNFYIELLEEYPCDNVEQLNRKEGEWTRKLGTLNSQVQGRTREEHEIDTGCMAKYKVEHRDEILMKKKEHRQKHLEREREKNNKHYHANKAEIYERAKEWKSTKHTCECGSVYTNSHKAEHIKSKKHQASLTH